MWLPIRRSTIGIIMICYLVAPTICKKHGENIRGENDGGSLCTCDTPGAHDRILHSFGNSKYSSNGDKRPQLVA